jgi:hypothetical protein
MPLETNFNASPYFDDFNANSDFYRVLYRPAYAVQARELTQTQTILQNQIETFGKTVYKEGSVVEGCNLTFNNDYKYIKILDTDSNNNIVTVSDFVGNKAVSASNLQAIIINSASGLETNDPDLNTLYLSYLNSAVYANGSPQKTFDSGETISIRTADDIFVANVTVASTVYANPVGVGYSLSISEGTTFSKGFFVRIAPQTVLVSKYTNTPNGVSAGFVTNESIVTPDSDASLYDNAAGSTNFNAPGANRLKLSANLTVRDIATTNTSTANSTDFFSIVDFVGGKPIIKLSNAKYSTAFAAELARRTFEESGNYIVDPFELYVTSNTTNSNNLVLEVDKGVGYVQGYRVEFSDKNSVTMRKGTDNYYFPNQIVTANYGNYVFVNELAGIFDIYNLDTVELRSTAAAKVTAGDYNPASGSAPGTQIGTARIKDIEYYSGTPGTPSAVYKIYLFDIEITSPGYSFEDVKSIYATDSAGVPGYADPVLVSSKAVLRETAAGNLLFPLGRSSIKTINTTATYFTYRTQTTKTFQANGTATLVPPTSHPGGIDTIALTGSLSETNELRFIVVPNTSTRAVNSTGTATITTSSNVVTGTSTSFTTEYAVGDWVYVGNASSYDIGRVAAITNATYMTTVNTFSSSLSANGISRYFPAGIPISFTREDSANVVVASDGSTATFNLGCNLASTFTATIYYDVFRDEAVQAAKTINKNRFVKIQANTHPNLNRGPWNLGLPDVTKIRAIYQGTTYANTNPDYKSEFILDGGQRDDHYDLAFISLKPDTSHTVGADDLLLIELDHFTSDYSGGIGYFSIRSYPVDDSNTSNTSAITTQEIPQYTSKDGVLYDLRDSIDFRSFSTNTAVSTTVASSATVNPSSTLTLKIDADGAYTVLPDSNFGTAFSYYLGRKDKVALSPDGKINIIEGAPAPSPVSPRDQDGTMTLGTLAIPPYPSLSQSDVRTYGRPEYGVTIDLQQYRRYTMRDIGVIDQKVNRLEYYTSLSLLETSAKTFTVKDDTGAERFKNGFIVDSFKGFTVSDTKSPEYKSAIDIKMQEMAPTVKRTYVDVDIDLSGSTNVEKRGNLVMLTSNSVSYIEQPFASKFRNCVENIIYVWAGNIELTPEGDAQTDVDVRPDVVGNIDLSGLTDIINGLPNLLGTERVLSTTTNSNRVTSTTTGTVATGTTTTTVRDVVATTTTTTQRPELDFSASTISNSFDFGELVQDVSIQQFIRPRLISFKATGLKPNTIVYPYFDGVAVAQHVAPTNSSYVTTGAYGSVLTTDSTGTLYGVFRIPDATFKVGDRVLRLVDVDNLVTGSDAITTHAAATFTASNVKITKARYGLNTRLPQIAVRETGFVTTNTVVTSRTVSSFTSVTSTPPRPPVTRRPDPIAQTFYVDEVDSSGVYLDKIDLYFQSRHASLGVELQIREVENGSPSIKILPFGRTSLPRSSINVSSDASLASTFNFSTPVFLESGKEYCFVVLPIGSNDGYNIWCGEIGGTDITTNTPIYENNSTGVLFTSSTNRIWTPFQKEDIKFVIHRRRFNALNGTILYTNANTEYLTANNFKGEFNIGEKVYVSNAIATTSSNASGNATSNVISVVANASSNALSDYTNGQYVYVTSNTGSVTDVRYITSIPNSSHVVLNANLSFGDSNASVGYLKANGDLYGYLLRINGNNNIVHLERSSANSSVGFTNVVTGSANAILIGAESGARANLVSVDDVWYSTIIPQFSYVTPSETSTSFTIKGYGNSSLDSVGTSINVDIETFFTDQRRRVRSRSSELQNGTGKTIQLSIPLTTSTDTTSPVFDDIKSNVLVFENQISSNTSWAQETLPTGGNTAAKYISKRVVLAEGQDAEDLTVILTAYKPSGTDIKVYSKVINREDSQTIDDKYWTPMVQSTSEATISSRVDRNDFVELKYDMPANVLPTANPNGFSSFVFNSNSDVSNTNDTIAITNANTYFSPGTLVLYRGATGMGVTNNTFYYVSASNTTTVKLASSFGGANLNLTSNSGASNSTLYLIPYTAYRDSDSGAANSVSYFTTTGGYFHGFKTFAIKIVLTSEEGSHLVPRVADMRAIALQT